MNTVQVTAWTLEKDNLAQGGNECKFYRTFQVGNQWSVFQYGSQRGGRHGGSYKVEAGQSSAVSKRDSKERGGYVRVADEFAIPFTIDADKFSDALAKGGDRAAGVLVENVYHAARQQARAGRRSGVQTCTACGQQFMNLNALKTHERTHDRSKPASKPADAPVTVDRIGDLSGQLLEAISLAAEKPSEAMVIYATLEANVEAIDTDVRRLKSYMETLGILVEEAVTA